MAFLRLDGTSDPIATILALGEVLEGKSKLIVKSSGSTGVPKEIELDGATLNRNAIASAVRLGGHGQWLLALPINYIAGAMVLVRSLIADTQPVIMNTAVPFTAEGFVRSAALMRSERRYTSLVPAQLARLFDASKTDDSVLPALKRFDAILIGGQAPNPKIVDALREAQVNLVITYGSAETGGGVVYDGVPLDGIELNINPEGCIVIDDFTTHDLGEIVDGKLVIKGRADRVINSGGHKLSLEAVEQWTLAQPRVRDAAAVMVTHEEFGESFVCFFESESEPDVSKAPLALGIVAKSGTWKSIEKLPTLNNGKPDLQFLTVLANQIGESLG